MNAITKALVDSERSYIAAKAKVGQSADALISRGPTGSVMGEQSGFRNAKQQLDAFTNWVFNAIRPICNRIAAQPIKVGKPKRPPRTKAPTNIEALDEHPIIDLLADPNDLMTGWGLMWATVASINLCGRAFWWIPEGNENLFSLPCSWVTGFTGTTKFQSWQVQPPGTGEPFDIASERMVYFALPSPSDPWGCISPLQTAAAAVNNDDDILSSQRAAFSHGIFATHAVIVGKNPHPEVPGGVRPRLTPSQERQIISAIQRRYSGTANRGECVILDGLIEDIKRLTNTPAEMDYQSSAEAMKKRILEAFGTSPYILGSSEPGSRAASAVAEQHFIASTVNPLIRMMSEAMQEWLAPMFSTEGERIKVWIEPCVVNDAEMQEQWAELLAGNKVLTGNELRKLSPLGLGEDAQFAGVVTGGVQVELTQQTGKAMDELHQAADALRAPTTFFEDADGRLVSLRNGRNGNGAVHR